jgi:hypothetical protein
VEALVEETSGSAYLEDQKAKAELALVNREMKRLKKQIAVLEEKRTKPMARQAD